MRQHFSFKKAAVFALLLTAAAATVVLNGSSKESAECSGVPLADNGRLTLVIDAGHGGEDGGAVSDTGNIESEINLSIALKLEQIMGLYGVDPVMTRSSGDISYPDDAGTISSKKTADTRNRVKLVNSIDNPVLISIHQNKYTSSGPFGAQVLYSDTSGSKDFAETLQELLISKINPENYRTASEIQENVYIMNNVDCPAVLVECGFLSNPDENRLLETDSYKTKLAAVIASGYLTCEKELESVDNGGTNES